MPFVLEKVDLETIPLDLKTFEFCQSTLVVAGTIQVFRFEIQNFINVNAVEYTLALLNIKFFNFISQFI